MAIPFLPDKPMVWFGEKRSGAKDLDVFSMTEDHAGEAILRVRVRSGVQGKQRLVYMALT